ncbi:serine hydrolase domain-containing protein [Sphingomonas sp. PR090111-T3T-6A]|uniref:serine hydrolase domain-containing protein n=1 Tax=Sphingomonas sp. PR090111-T3T-6A TaxID=685778 RepID=UPI0003760D75|nr:serine hydrolase domain-containing protein [Sphingomonas sp. PR090111-T3T-6A]
MRLALASFAALIAATPALSAPLDTAAIDRAAAEILKTTQVPSASIAVVEDGRIVYSKAYGQQGPGKPAVTGARYPIASISKQITATAILMLADEGKLSLDDKVSKWLPDLTDADKITVAQVLSHTSGYRDYWPQDFSFAAMEHPVTPAEILDRWAKAPLDFAPGSQWQYSNTGYVIAGRIVEKVSGEPLVPFLSKRVFQPLAMKSAVDADTGMTAADAVPHMRYALGPVRVEKPAAPGWLFAAGELAMTADDLARWDIGMIDAKLLSPAGYKAQQTPVTLTDGKSSGYGLGIEIGEVDGHRMLEHGGEAVGFLSENRVYPDDKAAIVVMVNGDFGNAQTAIADRIEAQLFPQADKTARARKVFDMLRAGKIDRSLFTVNGNYYFTPTAIADYRASLAPLGQPTGIRQRSAKLRGGFTAEAYTVTYPGRTLTIVLRAEPGANGKIEQFTVYPAG